MGLSTRVVEQDLAIGDVPFGRGPSPRVGEQQTSAVPPPRTADTHRVASAPGDILSPGVLIDTLRGTRLPWMCSTRRTRSPADPVPGAATS
ncbi:hypothetical protein [Streptomyces sp. enrichment culture]|uniref:hypothetical protein n=1 Tax=Streptomyces sp. enrichment culture TaxID=1795815 RepID=UPI003F562A28